MNDQATTAVARPLSAQRPLLLPLRDVPYRLLDVYELVEDACRGEIVLDFRDGHLLFQVDEDTDSLCAQFRESEFVPQVGHHSLRTASPWGQLVGKECCWTWVAVNQQGYCDSVLLSFDGIIPSVLLQVIASSLGAFTVAPVA